MTKSPKIMTRVGTDQEEHGDEQEGQDDQDDGK
jgi:hypothetical protein